MDMKVYVQGKTKNELLHELGGSEPQSLIFELQKAGIVVRCAEDVEKRMNELGQVVSMVGNALSKEVDDLAQAIGAAALQLRGQIDQFEGTIKAAGKQNDALQKKLIFLNIVLAVATAVAAVATALDAWKAFHVH
jgi:hypothetical protein